MFVLKSDGSVADAFVTKTLGGSHTELWLTFDVTFDAAALTTFVAHGSGDFGDLEGASSFLFGLNCGGSGLNRWVEDWSWVGGSLSGTSPPMTALVWRTVELHVLTTGGSPVAAAYVDGTLQWSDTGVAPAATMNTIRVGQQFASNFANAVAYIRNVKVGSTRGASDIFADDFSSGNTSAWTSATGSVSVVSDPVVSVPQGRVLIAFDDGPLVADPTWTRIDGGDAPFPQNFVSGYDVSVGRQTLLNQTDTGTATVYIYDRAGLFDPRNMSSPYFGLLDGRQILLQLYDPVAAAWEDQFRGHINDISWDIDGSAVNAAGEPINASIQLDCVDIFDFLAGYGLTPGLDGVTPPVGAEDGVYYATTVGTVDDRILAILNDVGLDPARSSVASGNVHVLAAKYDPDESALQALRDAADADLPFIANTYCDRHGVFIFRGRGSRFDPDFVSAEPGSTWDFTRWAAGDGTAIVADSNRAQLRSFAFGRNRSDTINVATCWPQDLLPADMPSQVFADTTSITDYGKHAAPPMSDLLLDKDAIQPVTGFTGKVECFHYAKLVVQNHKDPRETLTTLGFKSMRPDGSTRAQKTWALMTKADISHIVNVAVGYPGGTGLAGDSPTDDYYIEGRHLRVRPLNSSHDYVELDLDVSPAVWSMDTHSVFPA